MSDLQPGIFLDVQIGILCGDLPPDFKLREGEDSEPIRCYSTDANAAIHAAQKVGVFPGWNLRESDSWELWKLGQGYEDEPYPDDDILGRGTTAALAICDAILRRGNPDRLRYD